RFGSSRRARWFGEKSVSAAGTAAAKNRAAAAAAHATGQDADTTMQSAPSTSAIDRSSQRRWSIVLAVVAALSLVTLASADVSGHASLPAFRSECPASPARMYSVSVAFSNPFPEQLERTATEVGPCRAASA